MDNQNNYQEEFQTAKNFNQQRTPSTLITAFSGIGAIALLIAVIIFISKTAEHMNTQLIFNLMNQGCILVSAIVFWAYYGIFYKNNNGEMLIVGAFALISIAEAVGILNVIITIVEVKGDFSKTFISNLPQLSTPIIIGILFMLVAKNFYKKSFSKTTYTMALGFVLAACPQSVISALCSLMLSTQTDNSGLVYVFLLALGQTLLYTAMLVFGVKEYYDKTK